MEVPIEIRVKDIQNKLITLVNRAVKEYGIPYTVLEILLNDLSLQCKIQSIEELEKAIAKTKEEEDNTSNEASSLSF